MNLLRRGTRASSRAGEGGRLDTRLGEELGTRSRCRDSSGGVRMESLEARGREACVRPRPPLPPLPPENIPGVLTLLPKQSTHPKKIPEFASSHPEETDLCLVPGVGGVPGGFLGCPSPSPHSVASSWHLPRDGGVEHPRSLLHRFPWHSQKTMEGAAEHSRAGGDITNARGRAGSSRFLCPCDGLHHFPLSRALLNLRSAGFSGKGGTWSRNFDPKNCCEGIGILPLSAVPLTSPQSWKIWAQVPFPSGKDQTTSPTRQVPPCTCFIPYFGKPIPPGRGKNRDSVARQERTSKAGGANAPENSPRNPRRGHHSSSSKGLENETTPGAGGWNSALPTPRGVSPSQGSGVVLALALCSFRLGVDGFFFFFSLMRSFSFPPSQKKGGVSTSLAVAWGRGGGFGGWGFPDPGNAAGRLSCCLGRACRSLGS